MGSCIITYGTHLLKEPGNKSDKFGKATKDLEKYLPLVMKLMYFKVTYLTIKKYELCNIVVKDDLD